MRRSRREPGGPAVLELDIQYLARREVPLIRIVRQANQPMALVDLASFALYALRILVRIHTWTFRKPDKPRAREVCRLPGDRSGPRAGRRSRRSPSAAKTASRGGWSTFASRATRIPTAPPGRCS